ncbi:hypothetical protein [Streptomyces sp. NPDC052610]|uniref:hypothetical protein n=1 Tax=Streptomyces sp. NPDC052610 TaxID=3154952 RepID=UPI003419EADF
MNEMKVAMAAAVAGGYLLGRTKKGKLALVVGSYLAGRRLGVSPAQLVSQGLARLQEAPQFQELSDQVRGELMQAGRTAVSGAANRRLTGLADALRDRTDALNGATGSVGARGGRRDDDYGEDDYEDYPEDEYADDEYDEAYDDEARDLKPPARTTPARESAPKPPAKKAAAKKTAAKKAAAKKTAAKRAPSGGGATRSRRGR